MEQIIPRDVLWGDRKTMGEFLKEPLNQKLYEVYLGVKRNAPSQDFQTLRLFNEVYYICSCIVYENHPDADLNEYIQEIKNDLGWDYPSSLALNMVYAVLALRKDNSEEVKSTIQKIRKHYRMDVYKSPFSLFVDEQLRIGALYHVNFENHLVIGAFNQARFLASKMAGKGKTIIQNITIENHFEKPVGAVVLPGTGDVKDFIEIKTVK